MSTHKVGKVKHIKFRFHLSLGACLFLSIPAHAQNTTLDPFSPNAVAPTVPSASPTAPAPVAPVFAPEPQAAPVPIVKQVPLETPAPMVAEDPVAPKVVAEPVKNLQPSPAEAKMFKVKAEPETTLSNSGAEDSSFFDRLADFFSSEEEEQPQNENAESLQENIEPEILEAEPAPEPIATAQKIQPMAEPAPEPVAKPIKIVEAEPEIQTLPANTQAEPFEPQKLAPTTPVESPKQITNLEQAPTTVAEEAPSSPGFLERLFSSEEEPVRTIVVEAEPVKEDIQPEKIIEPRKLEAQSIPDEGGMLDSIGNFFGGIFGSNEEASEKTKPLPVIEKADPVDLIPIEEEQKPKAPLDPRLIKATFALGKDIVLGQGDNDLSRDARCFTKNRGTVAYCITPTRWPARLQRHFDVSTHLYKGAQGITQYDGDIATRVYTLFNQEGFDTIVAYYEKNFGPPTHHFTRKTRTIQKGTLENPTYIWRREKPDEGLTEVFEIRKIADTRGSIPDLQRGSIRAYFEGSRQIFSLTSDLDYMSLK